MKKPKAKKQAQMPGARKRTRISCDVSRGKRRGVRRTKRRPLAGKPAKRKRWAGAKQPSRMFLAYERVPQPGGCVLLKPGKAITLEETMSVAEAARVLCMSRRWAQWQCDVGRFKTAWKPGTKSNSHWRVSRAEIMALREQAEA